MTIRNIIYVNIRSFLLSPMSFITYRK